MSRLDLEAAVVAVAAAVAVSMAISQTTTVISHHEHSYAGSYRRLRQLAEIEIVVHKTFLIL